MSKVTCSVVVNAHLSQLQDHLKWTGAVRHQQLPPPEHHLRLKTVFLQ